MILEAGKHGLVRKKGPERHMGCPTPLSAFTYPLLCNKFPQNLVVSNYTILLLFLVFSMDQEFGQDAAGSRCLCSVMWRYRGAPGRTQWLEPERLRPLTCLKIRAAWGLCWHRGWDSSPQLVWLPQGMVAGSKRASKDRQAEAVLPCMT